MRAFLTMPPRDSIRQARQLVDGATRISALTGAGISVASGVPDFRSEGGLWKRYDPLEFATYESFLSDPARFWTMGRELAEVFLKAAPNAAHKSLARLEEQGRLIGVITQNIDNLHQAAGSQNVIELHGNYLRAYCMACGKLYVGEGVHRRVAQGEIPPKCDNCGGVLKSEAVLFGEPLPQDAMRKAVEVCRRTDLMLVIGTSLQVYPAAYLPELAKKSGAKLIIIDLEGRTDSADLVIKGKATDIVPKVLGLQ
jgi:NAD-dependent deacetylase